VVALIITPTICLVMRGLLGHDAGLPLSEETLRTGTNAAAPLIALKFEAASPFVLSALFAAGLALFVLTLVVNFGASAVVEAGPTETIFGSPVDTRTADYVNSRFG
jgi:ABC-type phosphate transport system permease subunit